VATIASVIALLAATVVMVNETLAAFLDHDYLVHHCRPAVSHHRLGLSFSERFRSAMTNRMHAATT